MDHFTPFGARVEPPPVIPVRLRPRLSYEAGALVCCLAWAGVVLSLGNLAWQGWRTASAYEQHFIEEARR
jgi:hypothetical protein